MHCCLMSSPIYTSRVALVSDKQALPFSRRHFVLPWHVHFATPREEMLEGLGADYVFGPLNKSGPLLRVRKLFCESERRLGWTRGDAIDNR